MDPTRQPISPGPWRWFDYPDGRKLLSGRIRAVIHCPDAPMVVDPPDQLLIAAAPDLLEALKALRGNVEELSGFWNESTSNFVQMADAAIERAEGR